MDSPSHQLPEPRANLVGCPAARFVKLGNFIQRQVSAASRLTSRLASHCSMIEACRSAKSALLIFIGVGSWCCPIVMRGGWRAKKNSRPTNWLEVGRLRLTDTLWRVQGPVCVDIQAIVVARDCGAQAGTIRWWRDLLMNQLQQFLCEHRRLTRRPLFSSELTARVPDCSQHRKPNDLDARYNSIA
jgi:hypothetical protein